MENAQPLGHVGGNRGFRFRAQRLQQADAQAIVNEAEFGAGDVDDASTLQLLRRLLDFLERTVERLGDAGQRRSIAPEGKCNADFEDVTRQCARARDDGVGDVMPIDAGRSRAVDNPASVSLRDRRPVEQRPRGFLQIERQSGVGSGQPGVDDGAGGMIADRVSQQRNLVVRIERPEFDELDMRALQIRQSGFAASLGEDHPAKPQRLDRG